MDNVKKVIGLIEKGEGHTILHKKVTPPWGDDEMNATVKTLCERKYMLSYQTSFYKILLIFLLDKKNQLFSVNQLQY